MRRRPAIVLFLLVLLAIGGAVFYQFLRKDTAPSVPEINDYLINLPESSGWKFGPLTSTGHYYSHYAKPGLFKRLGLNRNIVRENYYGLGSDSAGDDIFITIWTENEQVAKIEIVAVSPETAFKEMLFRRFPSLRRRDLDPKR